MRNLAIAVAVLGATVLLGSSLAQAQSWRHHSRFHDDLAHRDFHRELDHREAHRYPMTWRQHGQLHDDLEHEAFHDRLEHRSYHRWRGGYGYGRPGCSIGGRGFYFRYGH